MAEQDNTAELYDKDMEEKEKEGKQAWEHIPDEKTALAEIPKAQINIGKNGLQLQTLNDLWRFCECVCNSGMAPKDVRKPEQALIKIQHGWEVGLSPMQSLHGIAIINGKPSLYGDSLKAVVLASKVCMFVSESISGEGNDMFAECVSQRKGAPEVLLTRYSVADAQQAGLWGKPGPWTTNPKRMLQMRARGFNLRDNFADVLCGLISAEEAQDYPSTEPPRIQEGDEVGASDLDQLAETAEAVELPEVTK